MDLTAIINQSKDAQVHILDKHPALLTILPLVYASWTDADLTKSERMDIQNIISEATWLKLEEKFTVQKWLDADNPPSETTLEEWALVIRQIAGHIPTSSKDCLVTLGTQIARIGEKEDYQSTTTSEALEDMHEIEEMLGQVCEETYLKLFSEDKLPLDLAEMGRKASFDVQAMNDFLDGDYAEIRRRTRNLLNQNEFKYIYDVPKRIYRDKVFDWLNIVADAGLGALAYPQENGGGGTMGGYLAAFETLAYHDMSLVVKFGVQFGLFGGSVAQLGTQRHHDQYLKQIGSLELPGCFAMTELGHGSNVRDIETTATYDFDTDEFIIHTPFPSARKEYIGNAGMHALMATVFAQLKIGEDEYGVHAFLVPIRNQAWQPLKGVRIGDSGAKMGLNGVDNGRLWFNNVRVPRENLLDRFGKVDQYGNYSSPIQNPRRRFFSMLGTLVGGRVGVPSAALSAAKSSLTIAIRYADKRRQFGADNQEETRLLDYTTHQRRLMPLLANAYALDFALKDLTAKYVSGIDSEDKRELEALAAGLKAFSTWNTTNTIQECRESCGGQGYLSVNRFAALKADTDVFTTFEGDNTVLMQLVAKSLLTKFKQEFNKDRGALGYIKFFTEQIATKFDELNPTIGRNTSQRFLRSADFHVNAFKYRERKLQIASANRLRGFIKRGITPYDAFIKVQTDLIELAHAHVERIVLESFVNGIEECEDPTLEAPLKKLCQLFALYHIEKNKGFFLETGYLEAPATKEISHQVQKLCYEVRTISVDLVNAFMIPKYCLSAPIAYL